MPACEPTDEKLRRNNDKAIGRGVMLFPQCVVSPQCPRPGAKHGCCSPIGNNRGDNREHWPWRVHLHRSRVGLMPSADEDDLAVEWARLVAEFGRERASRIWLERFSGFDEGQT